jgi:hypothetical protein
MHCWVVKLGLVYRQRYLYWMDILEIWFVEHLSWWIVARKCIGWLWMFVEVALFISSKTSYVPETNQGYPRKHSHLGAIQHQHAIENPQLLHRPSLHCPTGAMQSRRLDSTREWSISVVHVCCRCPYHCSRGPESRQPSNSQHCSIIHPGGEDPISLSPKPRRLISSFWKSIFFCFQREKIVIVGLLEEQPQISMVWSLCLRWPCHCSSRSPESEQLRNKYSTPLSDPLKKSQLLPKTLTIDVYGGDECGCHTFSLWIPMISCFQVKIIDCRSPWSAKSRCGLSSVNNNTNVGPTFRQKKHSEVTRMMCYFTSLMPSEGCRSDRLSVGCTESVCWLNRRVVAATGCG